MEYILLFIVTSAFYGAGIVRRENKRKRIYPKDHFFQERSHDEGALSKAIVELISFAGGIYLSLTLLTDFLGMSGIDKVLVMGVTFDPIAAVAIVLALLQPLYERYKWV